MNFLHIDLNLVIDQVLDIIVDDYCANVFSVYLCIGLVPEDESISKAELRLTDIAEYLDDDWILLARQLNISRQEIIRIQQEYGYVTEQVY